MKMINNKKLISSLILIGGGVMRKGETDRIDRWMLERVRNKKKTKTPKVLFIPSASRDLAEYTQDFSKRYRGYGTTVETLFLIKKKPSQAVVRKSFLEADLIYFGGGDANLLLDTFTKFDLESNCIKSIENNSIVSGLSAGAIIWGSKFLNFERRESKFINFRMENGLGWIDKLIIPHFNPTILKEEKVLSLVKSDLRSKALAVGNGTAAYWDSKFILHFKKQRSSCLGTSLSIKDLIQKYE